MHINLWSYSSNVGGLAVFLEGERKQFSPGGVGRLQPLLLPGPGQRRVCQRCRWLGVQVTPLSQTMGLGFSLNFYVLYRILHYSFTADLVISFIKSKMHISDLTFSVIYSGTSLLRSPSGVSQGDHNGEVAVLPR